MKILFIADLHIKLNTKNIPKEWAVNRYEMLFTKICEESLGKDLLILGGDVFDKLPSIEEVTLFLKLITIIPIRTLIYDGNHEALKRGSTFLTLLKDTVNSLNSKVMIIDGIYEENGIDFIPYTHLKTFNPKDFHNKILCTHVRGEIKPHVKPEINLDKLNRWEVVLAGDLHAYTNSQRNILYPGSPISTSFHRNNISNGAILFDTRSMQHDFIEFGLPQLLRKTVESEEEMIATDYDLTIYELIGNTADVANVENKLLDKKIVNKNTEASLDLSNKTVEQELIIYLKEVVLLDEDQVEDVLGVHYDYA